MTANPHGVLRFVNEAFVREVCRRFADELDAMPVVVLHGDAHLEQYAITPKGRGLSDFDYAAEGPPVVDVVRLGVSVVLAAQRLGFPSPLQQMFAGYIQALRHPQRRPEPPPIAARMRASFTDSPQTFFGEVDKLTTKTVASDQLQAALRRYASATGLGSGFFAIKWSGALRSGVGSALSEKYLFRVEGPTADAGDDRIVEAKRYDSLQGLSCISRGDGLKPEPLAVVRPSIPFHHYDRLALVGVGQRAFWFQLWSHNYRELSLSDLRSAAELQAVAYDAGYLLGAGHAIAKPSGAATSVNASRVLESMSVLRSDVERAIVELAAEITKQWVRLHDQLAR